MKTITRADLPKIRSFLALNCHPEKQAEQKWEEVFTHMGMVPCDDTIRGLKIVLYLCKKAEVILVDEVAIRGTESTMHALELVTRIKTDANEILTALEK